jgi:hypothetical protein
MGEIYNRQIEQKRKLHGFKGVWIPVEFLEFADGSLSFIEIHILAEIKNLCENGVYGNCVMSNESFSKFIGCSTKTVERAIKHLSDLHATSVKIEHTDRRGKTRYIFYNSDLFKRKTTSVEYIDKMSDDQQTLSLLNMSDQQTLSPDQQTLSPEKSASNSDCDCNSSTSNNNKNNNININNNKSTGAGASSKISHSRGFRRERQSLEDKLFSGEEIASQKKERKKESKYNRCLSEIDKRDFTDREKELLRQHIEWSFHSSDVNRNDEPRKYAKHLDELLELKGDKEKIIQRSIDKKWHCFYEFKSQNNANSYLDHSDSKIQLQTLSQEEAEAVLARDREEFGTI